MSKKALIVDAAIELFAKKGYESTSIQEITDYCGISKGAFYLSFKSKEELFLSIIDHITAKISTTIDQAVNSNIDTERKLYLYFSHLFEFVLSHRSLATIFTWERPRQIEEQVIQKLVFYEQQFSYSFLELLDSLYGKAVAETKYDLVVCVKGLLKGYMEYILFEQRPIDIPALAESLIDKIHALALHSRKTFLTKDTFDHPACFPAAVVTLEKIEQQIEITLSQAEQDLEKESLMLLKQELQSNTPQSAIAQGMLYNLRNFPGSQHIANLVSFYNKQQSFLQS